MSKKNSVKGRAIKTWRNILPDEQRWWNFIQGRVDNLAKDCGYQRVDVPVLVYSRIYDRNFKAGSDYVNQNMVEVKNEKRDKVVLRHDLMVPLAQAFVSHKMQNLSLPLRLYTSGHVFSLDEESEANCHQQDTFNFSLLGESDSSHDAQVVFMAYNFMLEFFDDVQLEINSLGCKSCQNNYIKRLLGFVKNDSGSKYCKTCQTMLDRDPLKIFECKNEKCQENLVEAPQSVDHLCDSCQKKFVKVLEDLDELEISYNLNPKTVSFAPYWNQTVFNIFRKNKAGEKQILLRGARQDGLVAALGGQNVGMLSFFGQMETIVSNLKEVEFKLPKFNDVDVFVARLGNDATKKCFKLFNDLRRRDIRARESFTKTGLKAQLESAQKVGAKYALIIGQKEIIDNTAIIRDMESGIQEIVSFEKILVEVEKRLTLEGNGKVVVSRLVTSN